VTRDLQILLAVKALVAAALPAADIRGFEADAAKPKKIGPDGCVVGHPMDHGDPETELSPLAYSYEGEIQLEIAAADGEGGEALDAMIAPLGAAIRANRTLGRLCDYLSARAPDRNDRTVAGLATSNGAIVAVVVEFTTEDPLA
jgi:hypothetical protein